MALKVPEVYETRDHVTREHRSYRLPRDRQRDVADLAHGVEETDAGVCTRYLLDTTCTGNVPDEVHLLELERWCDRHSIFHHPTVKSWFGRIRRARRAVAKMREDGLGFHADVLYVAYGPPDPFVSRWDAKDVAFFGPELSSLAKYVDVVEEKRVEMARAEAVALSNSERASSYDDVACRRIAILGGMPASHGAAVVDLLRHRERYAKALRDATSSEALLSMLSTSIERREGENDETFQQRKIAAADRRTFFLAQAAVQADKMLARASEIYHDAWLACP